MLLDETALGAYLDQAKFALSRVETKDLYTVKSDGGDFKRYKDGAPGPDPQRKEPWLKQLASDKLRGFRNERVHVVRSPLGTYLRYECEWGYLPNAQAGEKIAILDLAEEEAPDGILDEDFWIVDDGESVVRMIYDIAGRFIGAEIVDQQLVPIYVTAWRAASAAAVPIEQYWAAHPQYWRSNQAA